MRPWRHFFRSPLARHPSLLWRKMASRAGLRRRGEREAAAPPGLSQASYPSTWAPVLRAWAGSIPIRREPLPHGRVFGVDFDEDLLLRLCREGPRGGACGLEADIKLIWDYSRAHALFTRAAAGQPTLLEDTMFLHRWLEANADTRGPAWQCAMDIALRAVNWIFADALRDSQLSQSAGADAWSGWLWRHGHLIWQRLEARLVSSNHYLADLLGLFVIGSVFPTEAMARGWREFARREFPRALLAQTRRDGGLNEASLRYHALVTEMALLFRLAQGGPFPDRAEQRLLAMCRIVAEFQDAAGDLFAIGDDDSGRVLALDHAAPLGRGAVLLRLASSLLEQPFQSSAGMVCPESGWWVKRGGEFAAMLDFGGVGLCGLGAHAHNDDLSFCLEWHGRPVVVDPGTAFYTGDPAVRNRFRSTRHHNTLAVDGREQRPLGDELFQLRGSDRAFPAARADADAWSFKRPLGGGVLHCRTMRVTPDGVTVRDALEGTGRHQVQWRFHLHPGVRAARTEGGFRLEIGEAGALLLGVTGATLPLQVMPSEYSPRYGALDRTTVCAADGTLALPASVEWIFRPDG